MTDATALWQLFATGATVFFVVVGAVGLIRMSNISMAILTASLLAIPTVGFLTFALSPGPVSQPDVILLAGPFVGIALSLMLAGIALRLPFRRTPRWSSIHRQIPLTLVLWPCMVVAISDVVFVFEPWLAIANLAVNAAWFIAWIPRATRRFSTTASYEIAAPRARVFGFIADPANWPLYKPEIESTAIRPLGPLAVGSEIVATQRAAVPGLRGPRMLIPESFQTTEVVTELIPDERLASRRTDGPNASAEIQLTSTGGGTRVTTTVGMVVAYRYAVLGTRLALAGNRSTREAKARESQDRLRKLLEDRVTAG